MMAENPRALSVAADSQESLGFLFAYTPSEDSGANPTKRGHALLDELEPPWRFSYHSSVDALLSDLPTIYPHRIFSILVG